MVLLVGGGAGLFKYWKSVKKTRKLAEREFVKEAGSACTYTSIDDCLPAQAKMAKLALPFALQK